MHNDIEQTLAQTLNRKKPFSPRAVPWWNQECGTLAANLCYARDQDRQATHTALKKAMTKAKREWATEVINNAQNQDLWKIAKWRHGRWVSFIPAILTNNRLSSDDSSKAQAFRARFFNNHPPEVPEVFPDDPPHSMCGISSPSPKKRLPPPSQPHPTSLPLVHPARTTPWSNGPSRHTPNVSFTS